MKWVPRSSCFHVQPTAHGKACFDRRLKPAYERRGRGVYPQGPLTDSIAGVDPRVNVAIAIDDPSERIREAKIEEIRRIKDFVPKEEVPDLIRDLEEQMNIAATELEFEKAAEIRDRIKELKKAFML